MSFFVVTDHYGGTHSLTAKQLCERIVQDSKYDYNWIAPARELIRICKKTSFPAEYALAIKIAILNCFANIEHRENCGGDRYMDDPEDEKAVQYCYNSLYGIDTEEAVSARKRYFSEIIMNAEANGDFEEDEKKDRESWKKFYQRMKNI